MSSNATAWGWEISTQPYSKLILICLADHADAYGRCSFSLEWLAKRCELSVKEANTCLKELLSLNIIIQSPAGRIDRQFEPWIEILINIQKPTGNPSTETNRGLNHAKN